MEFHNHHLNHDMSLYGGGGGGGGGRDPSSNGEGGRPTWLSSAILRQQTPYDVDGNFLHLQTRENNASGQWLPRPHPTSQILRQTASVSAEIQTVEGDVGEREGGRGGGSKEEDGRTWQNARYKAEIVAHPLFEQLLSAHVACLRVATPVDQIPKIDAQLSQSQSVFARYSVLGGGTTGMPTMLGDDKELEQLLTHYVLLLCSFKEQLQQHVRVHAMEAVMACWEIEQSLQTLTGISPGEGTGATMSDDEDEPFDTEGGNFYEGNVDGTDSMGFGPLIPTESERSLMERVRQELKHELKQGYKDKIVDIREEILRKRRAGKLPGDTTLLLKAWWQSHSKWPYPTEDDKARLVQETGLQLKQINNWFINQRKRNWHTNPSSSNLLKSKRKSNAAAGDSSSERFM